MSDKNPDDLGALWQDRPDADRMSGTIICPHCDQPTKLAVFTNKYKTEDKHPAWRILRSRPKPTAVPAPDVIETPRDEDIPF
jgi:hypothetical protein